MLCVTRFCKQILSISTRIFGTTSNGNIVGKMPMELLHGKKLLNCSGSLVTAEKAIQNKNIIAFYFSASWCTPCKSFLPLIKNIYKENKEKDLGLEIIYVSSDKDEETMMKYFKEKHNGWYAVPLDDPLSEQLRQMFGVANIPHFFVVNAKGQVVSSKGRKEIEENGVNVLVMWNTDPI